jgi:hypothetical protein
VATGRSLLELFFLLSLFLPYAAIIALAVRKTWSAYLLAAFLLCQIIVNIGITIRAHLRGHTELTSPETTYTVLFVVMPLITTVLLYFGVNRTPSEH